MSEEQAPPASEAESGERTKAEAPPPPKGWAFWRPRVARGVLIGGVLFAAMKLAPSVPREQTLSVRAPELEAIVELELTVLDSSGAPQSSATLHPARPERELRHSVELPNGTYVVEVNALVERPGAPNGEKISRRVELRSEVRLEEHTVRVALTPDTNLR